MIDWSKKKKKKEYTFENTDYAIIRTERKENEVK